MPPNLTDSQKAQLIESRWDSSESVFDIVKKTYDTNLSIYQNNPPWNTSNTALRRKSKVRANRIFRDMESVINSLIANPPEPNFIGTRGTDEAKELAELQQKYFTKKYDDLNVKEQLRKGLRNLYLSRLIVLKPFWNAKINDFDVRSIDPRKIRVAKTATKEDDTDFVIEEVTDNLMSVLKRFPKKSKEILKLAGYKSETDAYIQNPSITYKEAWIGSMVYFKYGSTILGEIKNPYWDWDGLLVTSEEEQELKALGGEQRRNKLSQIRQEQSGRVKPSQDGMQEISPDNAEPTQDLHSYYFNHFDYPRKPYIFATAFNNENTPVGQTDLITQAAPLQEGIDRRKQDIDENASLVNGQIKVDSSVMSKADAQKLRYEARGVIWGKGVINGVAREMGTPLPQFVYEDMVDSRNEIDNIMAASSAFRGERDGAETKAGRLALIDQSYLALNELVQIVDYCSYELFNWFYQLAKVRYTEHHYAKFLGKDNSLQVFSLIQDDFEDGVEIKVIGGKTLPEDRQFKYSQAQEDVVAGILSPTDYFEVAGYDSPNDKAKNRIKYDLNAPKAVGMTDEELQEFAPPQAPEEKPPSTSISFKDLPVDGQAQLAEKAGIVLNPEILVGEKLAEQRQTKEKDALEAERTMSRGIRSPLQM